MFWILAWLYSVCNLYLIIFCMDSLHGYGLYGILTWFCYVWNHDMVMFCAESWPGHVLCGILTRLYPFMPLLRCEVPVPVLTPTWFLILERQYRFPIHTWVQPTAIWESCKTDAVEIVFGYRELEKWTSCKTDAVKIIFGYRVREKWASYKTDAVEIVFWYRVVRNTSQHASDRWTPCSEAGETDHHRTGLKS